MNTLNGSPRQVDDFQPRAQIKKKYQDGTLLLDNNESIEMFSKSLAVEERLIRNYLEHLEYLRLKKIKRTEARKQKKQEDANKTYDDFDWVGMFHKGTLDRLTVPMLHLFLERHHLAHGKMKKREKVLTIQRWLANSEVHRIQDVGFPDGNDSDDSDADSASDSDSDVVLMEVGDGSESESEVAHPQYSRSGRSCTTYMTRHFFGDSD